MSTNNVNIVNTNNWYQKMNLNGTQNITNMVLSGTNPSTQMALITVANDVHYCYSNYQLSKTNGFTLSFQLYITGTNMNSICAYFGVTDPTTSFDANGGLANQSGAVELMIRPGGGSGGQSIFNLYTNYGSNTIAATNGTSVTTGTWQTVTITYTPNSVGTWVVNYNGSNIISYNDSSYTTFASNQNTLWGIYGATANTVSASIRAVDLSVKQSMPLSALKNTYSFYPEECFINELSTYSQNNIGAAFGLRLLKADYLGPIINVRRGSDNATLDFYADSKGNLGTSLYGAGTTLLTWLAGSIGYVTRWYDQSNNGRDVIQATNANQPKIGTPILDRLSSSGKSAARGIYCLYRANSTYTGPTIKLRRSSDNAVSDFYADIYGNLGTSANATGTSFSSWNGSSTSYVDTWYDQSGSGNHATQSTTANQPVYNGTLKLIDTLNSSSLFLNMPSGTVPTGTLNAPYSFVVRHGSFNNTNGAFIGSGIWSNSQSNVVRLYSDLPNGYANYWYNNDLLFGTNAAGNGNTVAITYTGTVHTAYVNGTLSNTNSNHTGGTTAAGQQYLFRSPGGEYLNGQMYSVFIFGSALSDSDRMACQSSPTEVNIRYDGSASYLYNGSSNVPLTSGLDNYTYVCNYTPMSNGFSSIVEQGSNPFASNTRAGFLISNANTLYFTGQFNDTYMHYTSFFTPRKTVLMCNHNLSSGNILANDNGTIYTYTTNSPSSLAVAASIFSIGRNAQGGEYFNGNINEIIVFRNTLTTKESMLYFTPSAITRKSYRSQPRLQIKDLIKDNGSIPTGAVVAIDTQMLANMSPGALVTSWKDFTGYNNPVLNAETNINSIIYNIPPYVSLVNASSQYFNAGSKTFNISTNGGFTIIWYGAFTSSGNNYERIFDFHNSGPNDNILVTRVGTGTTIRFAIRVGTSTEYAIDLASGITQNEWAVWTFRYNNSNRAMEILKNGVLLSSGTAGATISNRTLTNTWIGRSAWSSDAYSSINTVGLYVYDSCLADNAQVATISNHLMYCTSSNFPSVLPDYNNKVIRYGSALSQGFRNGQAIRFNGNVNSYIDIQDVPNWPLTFCFWFYNTSTADTSPAALCSQDGNGGLYALGIQVDIYSNGTSFAPAYSTNGSSYNGMTTTTVSLNTWHHVTFTVSPTTIAYYINGTLIQSVSAVVFNTNRLIIGKAADNVRPLNGYIQDVRIYDYILRSDEISDVISTSAERYLLNYNTPTNYLVNVSNWYSFMNLYKSGSFTIATGLSDPEYYVKLTNSGTANSSNTLFNSTKIQNYNNFTCSFMLYMDTATDHGFYFYCGATSSTTVPTGTVGTSANSSYYVYFQITGTKGIYLFNDQGQQLSYSPFSINVLTNSVYIPITITYNRSVKNTWTINMSGNEVLKYDDQNNTNWVSNIAGDFWGLGARTTTSGMNCFIRRVELSYTPFVNSVDKVVNSQNNTKFPISAMTANSTTFTGSSILNGVYTASQSNGANAAYQAFDNNTGTYCFELGGVYAGTLGAYSGSVTTSVTNLSTNTSTSYSGEWLQILVPNPVNLNSFGLMGRQDGSFFLYRTPNTFYVAGSNDGSSWELIHSTSGAQFTSSTQYFTCNANNNNKYRYFRLIITKIGNNGTSGDAAGAGANWLDVTAWDLYTQSTFVNTGVVAVPPYSMTANTTTFAGNSIYDGTYILTASNSTYQNLNTLYTICNDAYASTSNVFSPGQYYNANTGAYTGSTSTTVSGVSQSGEWVQMQVPNPIVLYSFELEFYWPTQSYTAKSFLIAASNDGTTWTNIYDNTNASFVYDTGQTFVVTGSPIPYRYFRLIVRSTSGVYGCDFWFLDQWKLYTNENDVNLMKFPPAPLTADSPVTFTTVNTNNWYNLMTYNGTLSGTDPLKQLQLTDGSNNGTYCYVTNQTPMIYDSFTFTFQLYCFNNSSGDWIQLYFGSGAYQVEFRFEVYFYQGIRLSTTNVSNAVSSGTTWYNSSWNNIRIEYKRSATNTWTMFFNETQIIQYSDPNWAKTPGSQWGFSSYNGAAKFTSYIRNLEMTISPQTQPGNSLVSGSYTASASTIYENNNVSIPSNAFNDSIKNTSIISMWHSGLNYSSGSYTGAVSTTVSGTSYSGDWFQLQTPRPLSLYSFSIYPRQDSGLFNSRSPKNFVIAGSNDGSTWSLLHTATGVNDWWSGGNKYFVCNGGGNLASKYSYFRFITTAVNGGNSVNIQNLNLYTPISLNNSITPATPKGLLDGLTWKYYNGDSGDSVSYYTTNTYINIGRCINTTNINTLTSGQYPVNNGDSYSMEIFGYFRATVSGTYTFSLATDDGSYMWIGANALVGYTTSNANIINGGARAMTTVTCNITLLAGTYYPIRIHYREVNNDNDLRFSFTPPGGTQTFNGQGYFFSGTGLDSAFPQENAKIIKDLTGTNTDGVYYILVNGISTPIHCLMNDCYDGGGWMMLMKGTRGTTFQYSSSYWTMRNTLNASDTTRNDADAKYDTFNYSTVKDVLAIWPDIPSTSYTNRYGRNGGSIFVNDGWSWMVNNWNETTRTTPYTGFSTARTPRQNTSSIFQTYGINNPFVYNGFGSWCSNQTGAYVHYFSTNGTNNLFRWGFLFNNENNTYSNTDAFCGIGMGGSVSYSAGDYYGCCGTAGINRSARFELYGR
jgi:hypothetical protein